MCVADVVDVDMFEFSSRVAENDSREVSVIIYLTKRLITMQTFSQSVATKTN